MTDRESQDYGRRAYAQYRKALSEVFPQMDEILPPEYDELRPGEREVWDKMGAWVAEEVDEAIEQASIDYGFERAW